VRIVADAVEAHPESARARALLGTWVEVCEKFLAGRLYAGEVRLELPWRGATDTEQARSARDKALAGRRAKVEANVARARKLLAAGGQQPGSVNR
jgi:hypothetical protein